MNNQFGLVNVWAQGDLITRFIALLLLGMSLVSWVVILMKALGLRRLSRQAQRIEPFWTSQHYDDGVGKLGNEPFNPFRALAEQGRDASAHHRAAHARLQDELNRSDWITRSLRGSLDESLHRMQAGLAALASIGSTSPFVGLFGTVWGIYHALLSIGVAGQATIDKVAGPIGEALIMTALGLGVAIPAVLSYNALVRGNKRTVAQLNRFAHDLHAYLLTGARVGRGSSLPEDSARPLVESQKSAIKNEAIDLATTGLDEDALGSLGAQRPARGPRRPRSANRVNPARDGE